MSNIQVTAFLQFCRVRVMEKTVELEKNSVHIKLRLDIRYTPLCSNCKERVKYIHSSNQRIVRNLNPIDVPSYLSVVYRRVRCKCCLHAWIVFDQFHAGAASNRVIDKVRNSEHRKATDKGKEVIKESKYKYSYRTITYKY